MTPSKRQTGMTLVEVLISFGLFGIISLSIATLFADFSIKKASSDNETSLAQDMIEMNFYLETMLSNTTRLISCACSGGTGCVFDEAGILTNGVLKPSQPPGLAAGVPSIVLRLEVEDYLNPTGIPVANCVLPNVRAATTSEGLQPRGCKKNIGIRYTPPTPTLPGAPFRVGNPGVLEIVELSNTDPISGAVVRSMAQLRGVYHFACGHLANPLIPVPPTSHIRLHIEAKARATNAPTNDPALTQIPFDGWHPLDPGFEKGVHRKQQLDYTFRNLNTRGILFGKAVSFVTCVRVGEVAPQGNCCSGHRGAGNRCIDPTACITSGNSFVGDFSSCCSHMENGSGTCL